VKRERPLAERLASPRRFSDKKNNTVFDIQLGPLGEVVITGRLDAMQCEAARRFLEKAARSRIDDLAGLDHVASSGLLPRKKRLRAAGRT